MVPRNTEIAQPQRAPHARLAAAGSWVFDRTRFSSVTWPTPLAPAPKSIVFRTFGQTMVQTHGPTLSRKSDRKELQVLCGQTFVQKRPNDGSSHKTSLYRFVSWRDRNPEGPAKRESRTPQCRQRAGVFPISPCPREEGR